AATLLSAIRTVQSGDVEEDAGVRSRPLGGDASARCGTHRHEPFARPHHAYDRLAAGRKVRLERLRPPLSPTVAARDAWPRALRNRSPPAALARTYRNELGHRYALLQVKEMPPSPIPYTA